MRRGKIPRLYPMLWNLSAVAPVVHEPLQCGLKYPFHLVPAVVEGQRPKPDRLPLWLGVAAGSEEAERMLVQALFQLDVVGAEDMQMHFGAVGGVNNLRRNRMDAAGTCSCGCEDTQRPEDSLPKAAGSRKAWAVHRDCDDGVACDDEKHTALDKAAELLQKLLAWLPQRKMKHDLLDLAIDHFAPPAPAGIHPAELDSA